MAPATGPDRNGDSRVGLAFQAGPKSRTLARYRSAGRSALLLSGMARATGPDRPVVNPSGWRSRRARRAGRLRVTAQPDAVALPLSLPVFSSNAVADNSNGFGQRRPALASLRLER